MRSKKIFAASVAAIMAATSVYVVAAAEEQPEESGAAVDITTIKGGRKTATATKENQTVEVSVLHYVESFSVVLEGLDAGLTVTENETPANGEIKLTNCTYNSGTGKLTISVTEDNIKSGSAAAAYAIYESDSVKAATVTVNITAVVQTPNMEVSAVTFAGEDLAKDENDVYTAASDVSSSRDLTITVSGSHLVPQSALTGTADKAGYVVTCDEADSVSGGGLNSTITFKNKTLTTEAETVNVYVTPFITNNSGEKETISEHKQTITVKVARETADDEEEKTATVTLGDVVVKVGGTVITKNSDGKYAVPAGTERVSIEAEVTVKNCTVVANDSVDVTRNNVIFAFCEYNDGKLFETLNLEDAAGTITFRYSIANGEYYPVAADLVTIEVVKDTSGTTSGDESSDISTETSSDTSSETTSSTTSDTSSSDTPVAPVEVEKVETDVALGETATVDAGELGEVSVEIDAEDTALEGAKVEFAATNAEQTVKSELEAAVGAAATEETKAKAEAAVEAVKSGDAISLDIGFTKNGADVQPGKAVTVTVPLPEFLKKAAKLFVYHVSENGFEDVTDKCSYADGKLVIKNDRFSPYIVSKVEIKAEAAASTPATSTPASNPVTGAGFAAAPIILAAGAAAIVVGKKRK